MKNIHLTDAQYREILNKILEVVQQENFHAIVEDSEQIGNKYTTSNCGLCSQQYTTQETAMFPEDWPSRRELKYTLANHRCPFDSRESANYSYGCFFYCILKRQKTNLAPLVEKAIQWANL